MTNSAVPGKLSDESRKVYDSIVNGPRGSASAFPLIDEHGALVGPFGLMVRFPALGEPLQLLGVALRYGTKTSERGREIAILTVARVSRSSFEAYAHTLVALKSGLTEAEVSDLLSGDFKSGDAYEQGIYQLADDLLTHSSLGQVDSGLDNATVAEVVALVGYYRLLAQLMTQFGVGAPASIPSPQRSEQNLGDI